MCNGFWKTRPVFSISENENIPLYSSVILSCWKVGDVGSFASLPARDIWQTQGKGRGYYCLQQAEVRNTSYNVQDSPTTDKDLAPNINCAEAENL